MRSSILFVLSVVASCATPDDGSATLVATTQAITGNSVSSVTVEITGPGMNPITYDLVDSQGTWQGTIHTIPAGTDRTVHADARDASNTIIYSGEATGVTIERGQTAAIALVLQDVSPAPPFSNNVPQIDSLVASSSEAAPGDSISLDVGAHDPDATDTLTYAWTATGGTFGDPSAPATSWTAPATEGAQMLTIRVTDSKGSTAAMSFAVAVTPGRGTANVSTTFNTWPQVLGIVASPTRIDAGETTALTLSAHDNDGDALSYVWTATCAGTFDNAVAQNPSFTLGSTVSGTSCALIVTVNDGRGGTARGTISIQTGPAVPPNYAPLVDSAFQSEDAARGGDTVKFAIAAHDPDGTAVTIAWSANVGALGTATVTGPGASSVVWTAPACFDPATPPAIAATITDATGVSTTFGFTVTAAAGACVVTTISTGESAPRRIAATSAGDLYWGNYGSNELRAFHPGTGTVTVATDERGADGVAVDATNVYWSDRNSGNIQEMPLAGGAITTIGHGTGCPEDMVVDATNVYWVDCGSIDKAAIDNSGWTTLVTNLTGASPQGVFVDGPNVFWTNNYNNNAEGYSVRYVPAAGGVADTLVAASQDAPWGIVVVDSYVYWTNQGDGTIYRALKDGSGSPELLASGEAQPINMVTDGTSLFWLDKGFAANDGSVRTMLIAGGAPVTIAANQAQPSGIAVTASVIAWVNNGDGTVREANR